MLAALQGDPAERATLDIVLPDADRVLGVVGTDVKAGTFEYRMAPREGLLLSAGCARILGMDEGDLPRDRLASDWMLSRLHPEDLQPLMMAAASMNSTGPSQPVRLRVQHHDGRWIRVGGLVRVIAGAPQRVVGLVWEWTATLAHLTPESSEPERATA